MHSAERRKQAKFMRQIQINDAMICLNECEIFHLFSFRRDIISSRSEYNSELIYLCRNVVVMMIVDLADFQALYETSERMMRSNHKLLRC